MQFKPHSRPVFCRQGEIFDACSAMRCAVVALFAAVMSVCALHAGAHRPHAELPLAPEPPAKEVNLTRILSLDGPFGTFLSYLQQTDVVQVFQKQAYLTDHGITILVPVDNAFAAVEPSVLSGLSRHQLKNLMLYHSLGKRYELSEFESLGRSNPVTTLAGRPYTVNVTCAGGTVHVTSRWADARIVGSVSVAAPVALYELDRVLLPDSLFPARPPVAEPPAPAPSHTGAGAPAPARSGPVVPRQYGSAGTADKPSSSACRPGAAGVYVHVAYAAIGALATLVAF